MRSIKYSNYLAIVKAIVSGGPVPRVKLADATGLTKTTVSNIVSALIRLNIVREVDKGPASKSGGRKPILLESVPGAVLAIGVDIRRERLSTILIDMALRVFKRDAITLPDRLSTDEGLQVLFGCIDRMTEGVDRKRVVGIGIGVSSPVDIHSGSVVSFAPVPWRGISLRDVVSEHYNTPVYVDVGSNMAAYGEVLVEPDLLDKTVVYVTLGTGIGAGLVLSGGIHQAGPVNGFGHSSINFGGPECECGNRGCLESYVSTSAMVKRYVELKNKDTLPPRLDVTIEEMLEAANAGEPAARQVLEETASILGIALTSLANTIGPDVIIVGGSIPGIGEALAPLVKRVLDHRLGRICGRDLSVVSARLGDKSIALGAAGFCFGKLLESRIAFAKLVSSLEE